MAPTSASPYKVDGKTVTESFPNRAAQRKAVRDIAGFRRYQELSGLRWDDPGRRYTKRGPESTGSASGKPRESIRRDDGPAAGMRRL
jgi:hypothetical protein